MEAAICTHLDQIQVEKPEEFAGCEDCLKIGGTWLHLRVCRTCGHVACCDSSPNQHASAHAESSGHPIVSSLEPGEDWSWCYQDEVTFVVSAAP
jgi:Zn-finger in ubiquitin-hydrolases and other protein